PGSTPRDAPAARAARDRRSSPASPPGVPSWRPLSSRPPLPAPASSPPWGCRPSPSLSVHLLAVILENAHLATVREHLHAGAIRLLRPRIEERHVRYVDRQVLVHDAAGNALHGIGTLVLL